MKSNREWLSISDMMAGLMMVFLFIAVVFMQQVNKDKESLVEIASTYAETMSKLNEALHEEFDEQTLREWGAEILRDNTIRFKEPSVLFDMNKSVIKPRFKTILNDFFPRYVNILTKEEFKEDIVEVRIEGHTSSVGWRSDKSLESRYLRNAALSQERAFSVLNYLFKIDPIKKDQDWLIKVFRANGLAFAKLIYENGREDRKKSRRVEFRVITNTVLKIEEILKKSKNMAD